MARIRTIKPEFWTSESIAECSRDARLLFIGIWSFCDDGGVHPLSVKRIKMEVFPGDFDIDSSSIRRMIDELSSNGLIQLYAVENKEYLHVTGWQEHQRIDRPTYKYPQQNNETAKPLDEHSTSPHPRKGREGKGREWNGTGMDNIYTAKAVLGTFSQIENDSEPEKPEETKNPEKDEKPGKGDKPKQKRVPVQAIVDLYHKTLPELPCVQKLTPTRRGYIQQRWREDLPDLDHWRNYFDYVRQSDFLMGKRPGGGEQAPFLADLQWLTKAENYAKIAEGKYHRTLKAVH